MRKVFVVRLAEAERLELDALVRKGKASALTLARARILLKADQDREGEAQTDAQVAEALSVAAKTLFQRAPYRQSLRVMASTFSGQVS